MDIYFDLKLKITESIFILKHISKLKIIYYISIKRTLSLQIKKTMQNILKF